MSIPPIAEIPLKIALVLIAEYSPPSPCTEMRVIQPADDCTLSQLRKRSCLVRDSSSSTSQYLCRRMLSHAVAVSAGHLARGFQIGRCLVSSRITATAAM